MPTSPVPHTNPRDRWIMFNVSWDQSTILEVWLNHNRANRGGFMRIERPLPDDWPKPDEGQCFLVEEGETFEAYKAMREDEGPFPT